MGQVITNAHIVDPEKTKTISIIYKLKRVKATVLKMDFERDLAVLETSLTDTPAIPCSFGLVRGLDVLTLGYPEPHNEIASLTVSQGIVSDTFRTEDQKSRGWTFPTYRFKTDAMADKGSSGGPVIRISSQQWIGIICDGEKFSFMIPAVVVAHWLDSVDINFLWFGD